MLFRSLPLLLLPLLLFPVSLSVPPDGFTISFAPQIDSKAFDGGISSSNREVIATCYYPSNNPLWTSSMLQDYGGKLTWVAKVLFPILFIPLGIIILDN